MRTCATEGKGRCSFCCKALPVHELDKPQGKWCQHARKGEGCAIYADRPSACQTWRCLWLDLGEEALTAAPGSIWRELRRPDQVRYCIDVGVDLFYVDGKPVGCIVIYPDPDLPDAWRRDKVLIEAIKAFAQGGTATMVRYPTYGLSIFAPPLAPRWEETKAPYSRAATTLEEKQAFFGKQGFEVLEPMDQSETKL